jgi:hypothetical protein
MKHPISVSIKPAAAHTSPESNTLHVGNILERLVAGSDTQRERTLWRKPPNHWRTITRLGAAVQVTHQCSGVSHWADNQHHLAELTMTRDDVLVWLSFLGFVALSGAAIWVLFPL